MRKLLVANRGEIARRVLRAARALGIATAVVYSDADADALYVQEADEAVRLPGVLAADTYLSIPAVVAAATAVGADAVHPGYGFLSENAAFAAACAEAGLVFVGPPPAAIRDMGDKVRAKAMMAAAGVPTLAGFTVTDDSSDAELDAALAAMGVPAIVKASAGGGGRGMRIVERAEDLPGAIASARREALSSFGDATVFVERYLSPSRHIEVQVVADQHGNVATLFERECSIQRRHQKIVEEAPSPFVDAALRERLLTAAAAATRAVDYLGVGTVEFVVGADGTVAFLEMNTRLQVEHPVTELVTGVDLVALQLQVAQGLPLPEQVLHPTLRGHAIEVRLCAEDPAAGFLPAAGTFEVFDVDDSGIRLDTGVRAGSEVSPYYDSMVAKVIAWADTRAAAADVLADRLARARLHGPPTNRDMLVTVLRSAQFRAGDTTTDFVQRVPGLVTPLTPEAVHPVHAAAVAVALQSGAGTRPAGLPALPVGWRNNRSSLETVELKLDGRALRVGCDVSGPQPVVDVDGHRTEVEVHGYAGGVVDATLAGVRRRYHVVVSGTGSVFVDSPLGSSEFHLVDRLPIPVSSGPVGGLTAPMPGLVIRVLAAVGDEVPANSPLLVLEAMKMEHTIVSPTAGTVAAINVVQGDQVERGAVLAAITPATDDNP